MYILYQLLEGKSVDPKFIQTVDRIRNLRNRAAHIRRPNDQEHSVSLSLELFESSQADQLSSPPMSADRLLLFIIPRDRSEFILGDLEEIFTSVVVPKYGIRYARVWYWGQVVVEGLSGVRQHLINIAGLATLTKIIDWILKRRS